MRGALLIALVACLTAPSDAQSTDDRAAPGTLTVHVDGLRAGRGALVVAVFRVADGFPWSADRAERVETVAAEARHVAVVLDGVAPGAVAVLVFHDRDGDGALRLDDAGRPAEGWAVSGLGPPTFRHAARGIDPGGVTITRLHLRYP